MSLSHTYKRFSCALLWGSWSLGSQVAVAFVSPLGLPASSLQQLHHQGRTPLLSRPYMPQLLPHRGVRMSVASPKPGQDVGETSQSEDCPALEQYADNLTQLAAQGKVQPIAGRDQELERMVQILLRRSKNNPILLGEPGVGKTALAYGLADRLIKGDFPLLEESVIYSLDLGRMIAGARFRGEFEERLKQVLEEVRTHPNVILFIDEIHTIMGAGSHEGGLDAANLMKPALARGGLRCIGATTQAEYSQHILKDAALERRFQPVVVEEPSVEQTIKILEGQREALEAHHRLGISDEVIVAAAKLSQQYIRNRRQPDKALDVLDEAASAAATYREDTEERAAIRVQIQQLYEQEKKALRDNDFQTAAELLTERKNLIAQEKSLGVEPPAEQDTAAPEPGELAQEEQEQEQAEPSAAWSKQVAVRDVQQVISSSTGVPISHLAASQSEKYLHMETALSQAVIGQSEAVHAVSKAVKRSAAGVKNPNRPIANFFFSGPTGVGKTELAKQLADLAFGGRDRLVRFDMSEYMEKNDIAKLIGAPPGYVGYDEEGTLIAAVQDKPYSVILFDEVEKAHPDIFQLMLQILDDGHCTSAKGKTVSFKNTILIFTSNIGAHALQKGAAGMGFAAVDEDGSLAQQRRQETVMNELKNFFRPEQIGRFEHIIVFNPLGKPEVQQIGQLMLQESITRLREQQQIEVSFSQSWMEQLIEQGYDPVYGARPMRRAIQWLFEDPMAMLILVGELRAGDRIEVTGLHQGLLQYRKRAPSA
ncbi:MAG: ATP-dependent Clp protease ATP-binding subunit [Zetaproteobacteria bacterium]|nr:ATP-dependent Clp protease ATP-binding subunit [Zetaproteobacteria bacterium]